jgi:hypothetical protein
LPLVYTTFKEVKGEFTVSGSVMCLVVRCHTLKTSLLIETLLCKGVEDHLVIITICEGKESRYHGQYLQLNKNENKFRVTTIYYLDFIQQSRSPDEEGRAIPLNVVVEKHKDDG